MITAQENRPDWSGVYTELGIETPPYDDTPLSGHIANHAAIRPTSPALSFGPRLISYADLDLASRKLAKGLAQAGIGKGDVVGLHMPNVPQYMVALIAISRLGAIGSGVSPLLAPPELAHQIKDAGIKAIISLVDLMPALAAMPQIPACLQLVIQTNARDHLDAPDFDLLSVGDVKSVPYLALLDNDGDIAQTPCAYDDTFMIQYTGGTTGKPKGAMLTLRGMMYNTYQANAADPEFVAGEEVFATAFPLFHVAGLFFALCAMRAGGLFLMLPNPRDSQAFVDFMRAHPPTRLGCVPALYEMLLQTPGIDQVDYTQLKTIKTGAAPMAASTRQKLSAVMGAGKMADVFGMTETSPCYTMHPITRYKEGSVGIPIPGADVRIVDVETGTHELRAGEPGEIITSGVHVMKGYLNLPNETKNALRELDGRIWMYSGDVGYMDQEGYVFVQDRAKDMLIVGGFKVFSVEVEDKLKSLPDIAQCAIIGYPDRDRPGNDVVNLFVEKTPQCTASDDELRQGITEFCRANMAPYKVPKRIHFIDAIPLTPVGKIDKKALRANEPA